MTFHPDSLIRVQRSDGSASKITSAGGVEEISAFWDGWKTLGSTTATAAVEAAAEVAPLPPEPRTPIGGLGAATSE